MNGKHWLASFMIVTLPVAELELGEAAPAVKRTTITAPIFELGRTPHTHFEINHQNTHVSYPGVSSGRAFKYDRFALHIRPESNRFRLIGHPDFDRQPMYSPLFENVEEVTDRLARLNCPSTQVEAVRRRVLQGAEVEIGGRGFPLMFPRAELERIGMNFRPPDC